MTISASRIRDVGLMNLLSITALVVAAMLGSPARADTYGLPIPKGTRQVEGDRYSSGRGLRDTVEFFRKELDQRGIAFQQIGPYRARSVDLARFLLEGGRVAAVHVYRSRGKTLIFFVKRRP